MCVLPASAKFGTFSGKSGSGGGSMTLESGKVTASTWCTLLSSIFVEVNGYDGGWYHLKRASKSATANNLTAFCTDPYIRIGASIHAGTNIGSIHLTSE